MTNAGQTNAKPPSAISKSLMILEALSSHSTLSDIAETTGISPSTAYRILQELIGLGWVLQSEKRVYAPGARLLGLSRVMSETTEYSRIAEPALRPLVEQTGRTVHFALLQGTELVYVAKLDGPGAYRMKSRVGNTVPLHTTAIGKALLACLPPDQVRSLARTTGLPAVTDRSITDPDTLLAHLDTVRARGWAEDDGENDEGVRCFGAVVCGAAGTPIGGISISGLTNDMPHEPGDDLIAPLLDAAAGISAAFGAGRTGA